MARTSYQIDLGGSPVDQSFYGDVVELTVAECSDAAGTAQLRLGIRPQQSGAWTYLDNDKLSLYTKVRVKVGFSGGGGLAGALGGLLGGSGGGDGLSAVFEGYVVAAALSLGETFADAYLDVTAMDTSVLMGLEEKVVRYPGLGDSEIAEQVLGGYGVQPQTDPTSPARQEDVTTVVQRGTDLQFVRALARKNGYEFSFEADKGGGQPTAHFHAPKLDGAPQPDLAVLFGDKTNLTRFSARLDGRRPLNVKAQQLDVKADDVSEAKVSDSQRAKLGAKGLDDLASGPLGSLVTPADALAQMLVLGPPTADAAELQAVAQAVRDEAAWCVAASGQVNSQAYQTVLRPRKLVLVKGAGAPYSGKYYVTRVVHQLKSDGTYTQSFEARRNALGVDGSESFGGGGLGLPIPGL